MSINSINRMNTVDSLNIIDTDNMKEEPVMSATLNKLSRVNLDGSVEMVAVFPNELSRKLESIGHPDALIKVNSLIDEKLPSDTQTTYLQKLQEHVKYGIDLNGKTYVPFYIGSSDSRKAISAWLDKELLPEIGKWAMCGLKTADLLVAPNKYLAYIGLLTSATKPFEAIFGNKLDPRRIAVVDDFYINVHDTADNVNGVDVEFAVQKDIKINAFDGCGLVDPSVTNRKACTLRAPWMKALIIPSDFKGFCKKNNVAKITDLWGNVHNVEDIDVVLTKACFKMAKQYASWNQYCDAFEELGHTICVCVEEHQPRTKWMPYQQLQTLCGNDDDVLTFAQIAAHTVYQWSDPKGAAKLIGGNVGKAVKLYPDLLADEHVLERLQESFASKRQTILGGKVPDLGYNAFLAPDPVALLQYVCGMPVTGSLKTGECFCSNCHDGEVDITRNPHFDHAHVILNNVRKPNKYFMGPTLYINIFDLTTIRLRADYDGDHVWYSQNEHLLDLVHRTDAQYGNLPIDWTAPESEKCKINKAVVARAFVNNTKPAQIGIYADALTKMFAHGYDRSVCAWLTYAGNVLIDAAKHGSANVEQSDDVKAVMKSKLPLFAKFAKADTDRPLTDESFWANRVETTDSFADRYSILCDEKLPKELTINGSEDFVFTASDLMIEPHRATGWSAGLYSKGVFNYETGNYEGDGLFNQIAFRHQNEWGELKKDIAAKKQTWEEIRGKAALDELTAWAAERGETVEALYDVIVRRVFAGKGSAGYMAVMKDAFWRIFGDMAVEVLKRKLDRDSNDDFDIDLDWMDEEDFEEE